MSPDAHALELAHADHDTRRRVLDAGGVVFAELGFRAATVRDICQRAGANVAAVNYHFRDKQSLYLAVIAHAESACRETCSPFAGLSAAPTPTQRLEAFLRAMFRRLLSAGVPAWHGQLMVREMAEPTAALDLIVRDTIRPMFDELKSIVAALAEASSDDERVDLCARSIVGQCVFYKHARHVIERLHGEPVGAAHIEELVAHTLAFSLGGVRTAFVSRARSSRRLDQKAVQKVARKPEVKSQPSSKPDPRRRARGGKPRR